MKNFRLIGCIVMGLALLLDGCTPKTPAPLVPAVTPLAPVPSAPTSNLPPPTSQDDAWAKVIQVAKKEGTINAYSFNMTGDVGIAVSRAFEQKYGIKVEIITGGGSALAQRIMTEKRMNTIVADLMDANTFQISNIKEVGATLSSADLPVLQEKGVWRVDPGDTDPQKHALMHTLVYNSAFINTNLIKPADEPKSFKELAGPKWRGKIVMIDPAINSGAANVFPTLIRRKLIDEETVKALGKNGIHYTPTSNEAQTSLLAGTYAVDLLSTGATYGSLLSGVASLPVKPIATEEGTVWANRALTAIKDSPHPNATRLFINWLLTQEGQIVLVKAQGATPMRSDVPDFTPAFLQIKPVSNLTNTLEDERTNTQLFREGWLAKLMKG